MNSHYILRLINSRLRRTGLFCSKGYTLMEMMLVSFLIVLILGTSAVFLAHSLPAAELRSTGRDMAASIKYAKSLARVSNERQVFDIDIDSKTYALEGREAKKIPSDIAITILDTNLDPINKGRFSIVFDAMGGGNDWHSIILSRGGSKTIIAMDPVMTAVIAEGPK